MADVGLPHAVVADQVARAIELVVHQARRPDGSRVVETIAEVLAHADGAEVCVVAEGGQVADLGDGRLARRLAGDAARITDAAARDTGERRDAR
jgi:hypothetical protein